MQGGLGDGGGIGVGGGREAQGGKDLALQQGWHVLAGGPLQRQPQQEVIGVRVVPVGARVVKQWP
ncbi:Uncharacterised protein [Mycobacterium tuberculosis]|uniref:Uncharacterized protein n=1 Tax=Mycobacterium tuberculosis TaxID=1773 RepID=A0A655A7G8_MYCTX|nr:Uncharacterised protein [Mycobacterium tuberculosis]